MQPTFCKGSPGVTTKKKCYFPDAERTEA